MSTAPASKFVAEVISKVTFTTLQMKPGIPVHVKILSAIEDSKTKVVKKGQENRAPAKIMRVLDLEDNEEKQVVCNKVLVGILVDEVKEYQGNCFRIMKAATANKGDAGDYYKFNVDKIKDPTIKK